MVEVGPLAQDPKAPDENISVLWNRKTKIDFLIDYRFFYVWSHRWAPCKRCRRMPRRWLCPRRCPGPVWRVWPPAAPDGHCCCSCLATAGRTQSSPSRIHRHCLKWRDSFWRTVDSWKRTFWNIFRAEQFSKLQKFCSLMKAFGGLYTIQNKQKQYSYTGTYVDAEHQHPNT